MKNLIFDFDGSEKDRTISRAKSAFSGYGATVAQVDVGQTVKRTSGINYREISFVFADSQTATMRIKQTGDVYQVLVNGKMVAIRSQDDHAAAIGEIVNIMDAGRAKFQKALASAKAKLPSGVKSAAPKLRDALVAKRDAMKEVVSGLESKLAALG